MIATNDSVFQLPFQAVGANSDVVSRSILSRGLDTNIVHESTNYFGAQGNQIISFKYFEQAQGYQGYNETKEYTPGIITQVEDIYTDT